ncbi:septum formation family protein [Arthrobacter sp. Sa2CUA1]|uniref:Septum formation family protein n=1 Tax=Arthrobacter gallicola TaxID=2762225 RepID=A0ABR8UU33_9MICC|nr:septum formation family protein [Arthrobacter gallicola]MBD7995736.1 septum formation family protein [Arthrobacter gallicola]
MPKGLLGSKSGAKRPALSTGPGAKDASGPADDPTLPPEPSSGHEVPDKGSTPGPKKSPEQGQGPETGAALPDLASHTEAPEWLSGDGSRDAEVWTEAFDAEVQQSPPAEPQVVPAEDVHLAEPTLGVPSISADVAEAASLPAAAAEVRAVSEEAAEAGKQAGIPEPAPEGTEVAVDAGEGLTELESDADGTTAAEATGEDSTAADEGADAGETKAEGAAETEPAATAADPETPDAAPAGAEPAADAGTETDTDADAGTDDAGTDTDTATGTSDTGAAASTASADSSQPTIVTSSVSSDSTDLAAPVTDSFASLALIKTVPAEDPADTGITHTVHPSGSTAVPADSRRARRTREAAEAAAKSTGSSSRTTRMLVLIGSILIIVLLGIWLATVVADSNREEGVLEESVSPIDLEAGACILDFQSVNAEVTVVTCETPHNAQLVASESYLNSDSFPGADALAAKAEEVCSSVMYTDAASKYVDLELNRAVPTQSSWDAGDRRVDCFVVAPGVELSESLIVQP